MENSREEKFVALKLFKVETKAITCFGPVHIIIFIKNKNEHKMMGSNVYSTVS
jgi:hypothetical protein